MGTFIRNSSASMISYPDALRLLLETTPQVSPRALENANTPEDWKSAHRP